MGTFSVGEALDLLLEKSQWKSRVNELRLRQDWDTIAGKTISKYTRNMHMENKVLTLYTDVAPLKHELQLGKVQLMQTINEYFGERVVEDIIIR